MRLLKVWLVCLIVLFICGVVHIPHEVKADDQGPEITDVHHVPKYPIYPDTVTVYATVIDVDGVAKVELSYCVDGGSCTAPLPMIRIGSSDVYFLNIKADKGWGSGTVIDYSISAEDTLAHYNSTEKFHYFYVSSIVVETEMVQDTAYEDEEFTISGKALYDGNETAPVEFSNVSVQVLGLGIEKNTATDINGEFNVDFIIDNPGDYELNTTVENRTLVGYDQITISVEPLIISRVSEILQLTTCFPNQEIWVNGTARYNSGSPVVYSDVLVKINDTLYWLGITDSEGDYAILISVPNELGQFDVNVSVTNGSLIGYNETSIWITEQPLPDLVVLTEDISFVSDRAPPLKYDEVNITVCVHNLGSANATNITVEIYHGIPEIENLIISYNISFLSFGSSDTSGVLWNASNGTHKFWVLVDPLNKTAETYENNNNASKSIFVDNDFDGDGIGDKADDDDDGDGVKDMKDEFPLNASEWSDLDGDGKGDNSDDDIDGDGIPNSEDAFPRDPDEWLDTDLDEIGNNEDTDDDNDGLLDIEEDVNQNGVVDEGETDPLNPDTDGDGENDKEDYDPLNPKIWEKKEEEFPIFYILLLVLIIIVALILVLFLFNRRKSQNLPPEEEEITNEED